MRSFGLAELEAGVNSFLIFHLLNDLEWFFAIVLNLRLCCEISLEWPTCLIVNSAVFTNSYFGWFIKYVLHPKQGSQMVYFQSKNSNLGSFWRALCRMENVGTFFAHLEYITAIWYPSFPFCNFVVIWYIVSRKNLATLIPSCLSWTLRLDDSFLKAAKCHLSHFLRALMETLNGKMVLIDRVRNFWDELINSKGN
jgi:hypothetical protein